MTRFADLRGVMIMARGVGVEKGGEIRFFLLLYVIKKCYRDFFSSVVTSNEINLNIYMGRRGCKYHLPLSRCLSY